MPGSQDTFLIMFTFLRKGLKVNTHQANIKEIFHQSECRRGLEACRENCLVLFRIIDFEASPREAGGKCFMMTILFRDSIDSLSSVHLYLIPVINDPPLSLLDISVCVYK